MVKLPSCGHANVGISYVICKISIILIELKNCYLVSFYSIVYESSTAKLLIEVGADIEHESHSGATALIWASSSCKSDKNKQMDSIKWLIL